MECHYSPNFSTACDNLYGQFYSKQMPPSLRVVSFIFVNFSAEFPADNNAMAPDGQAVAKWHFTPHPTNMPKMIECELDMNDEILASKIEAFKANKCHSLFSFISGDPWLSVFDFLPPRQLGLQIALISDRFDARVDTF
ncbi:hypothetical protein niasHT_020850 [Heterodera trifolii]|uniref:Uncharacterized protein n=1 Tax=Heterodera trifolii TaxID=157864 RepID=A0ABD2KLM3_9BILA